MKTNNPKVIGLVMLAIGLAITCFWGYSLFKIITYPFTGITAQARVTGYKLNHYGAREVDQNNSTTGIAGRSPFFEFETPNHESIKNYSKSPQIFILFNYEIDEKIRVAYPKNQPNESVIISWKEIPGLILMIAFGLIAMIVGKSNLVKK